jgi:DNA-binding MarR family transcriptional regulator
MNGASARKISYLRDAFLPSGVVMAKTSGKIERQDASPPASDAAANISYGSLPNKIGFHLRLCQEAFVRGFIARVGDADHKPQRYAILTLIHENPGITQTILSRCSRRDKSTLTPTLNDLEKRGLLERRRVTNDRRSYMLYLTESGRALLEKLNHHSDAYDREIEHFVGPRNKATLVRLLRQTTTALAQHED